MATFTESDLTFTFPDDWVVRKFDGTAAYRSVSGHGLKGVDFLCLPPGDEVWLVEVKNYRRRDERYRTERRNPAGLAERVGRKFSDSKRLVRIIHRAMLRRWVLRLYFSWFRLHPRPRPASHYWFWYEAERRLRSPRAVRCVLWLETPELKPDYQDSSRRNLEAELEPGNVLYVRQGSTAGDFPIRVGDTA